TNKKQPDSNAGLSEAANDWFRQFVKHLEIYLAETGQALRQDSDPADFCLAALRAVKLTLDDSGIGSDEIVDLLGRIAIEQTERGEQPVWNAELNRRRFELIDVDIQGKLTPAEQVELAGLTHLMREHADADYNVPLEGARRLHRHLTQLQSTGTDEEP
ncbi:MAG: hypothetical protein KDA59_24660, partial [Planctomycetales bacterium]|nr:hypothetical protein [Planctomycetales bacterium]